MSFPIKTLSQLSLFLKGFRKDKGLTQAAMGEKLGITQQSYAAFEANPEAATLERLFRVLRLLDVEISLNQNPSVSSPDIAPLRLQDKERLSATAGAAIRTSPKTASAVTIKKAKMPSSVAKASRVVAPTRKKESW